MTIKTLKTIIEKSEFYNWYIQFYEIDDLGDGYAVQFTYKGGNNYAVYGAHIEICNKGVFKGSYNLFIHSDEGGVGDGFIKAYLKLIEDIKKEYKKEDDEQKQRAIEQAQYKHAKDLIKNAIDKRALNKALSDEKSKNEIITILNKINY